MDKIKYAKSLKATFIKYVFIGLLGALLLSVFLSLILQYAQLEISSEAKILFLNEIGQYQEEITNTQPIRIWLYNILGIMSVAVYPICFIGFIIATSMLFYKNELKTPFDILNNAANHISNNSLDFTVSYDKNNEFGKLCLSFDKMRRSLKDNYLQGWRQAEERKRLNSAFSHDLRTPLTVLKGQSDMLIKYSSQMTSDKIIGTAEIMKRHIERMESYVETMNNLQRLEDIELNKTLVSIKDIENQLHLAGTSICEKQKFILNIRAEKGQQIRIDVDAIMQICENLLGNATRYAKSKVIMNIDIQNNYFIIDVSDDGKGFTEKEILYATNPFYKSDTKTEVEHFGIGLYICKILCEKHGGYIKLKNNNGAEITATFQI